MMDDLISRQAALVAIRNLYPDMPRAYGLNRWHEENDKYIECEEAINKLPSVKPKKGQWRYYDGMCSCSVCHSHMDDISPFCPMCGADMRG